MSLFKAIWNRIPCLLPHDGMLDIQPGLIRLRCAKCGRVTDGVEVPTFEEWQQVHMEANTFTVTQVNTGGPLVECKVLSFQRRAS